MFERIDGALSGLLTWVVATVAMLISGMAADALGLGWGWPLLVGTLTALGVGAGCATPARVEWIRRLDRERREIKEAKDG